MAAIFHLATHAFFKALLFLGSGSVIHALGGEQDMRAWAHLGGQDQSYLLDILMGALALSGIFPFAGFWSKDEILGMQFKGGGYGIWAVGLIAAFITAFYTFRLVLATFWGNDRTDPEVSKHIHESPKSMIIPSASSRCYPWGPARFLGCHPKTAYCTGSWSRYSEPPTTYRVWSTTVLEPWT